MLARREARFTPSTDLSKAVLLLLIIYVIFVLFLLFFRARLFIDALWSPAGKGQTSWLSFVMSYCEVVTFPLVFWARCISIPDFCPLSYFEKNMVVDTEEKKTDIWYACPCT